MSSKDIEKLKERVDKDPNSKLFVPLAEEYRKEGLVEEAIKVLQEGLERQPGYMSARVALGKIYLEKGLTQEAQGEFENVITAIPDNLYAHKKLADLYRDSGKRDLAIKSYRTVLKLNSMDEDAINNLHELEDSMREEESGLEATVLEGPEEEFPGVEADVAEDFIVTDSSFEAGETPADAPVEDELNAFKDSLFGEKGEETEEVLSIAEEGEEGFGEGSDALGLREDTAQKGRYTALERDEVAAGHGEVVSEEVPQAADEEKIPVLQKASESSKVSAVTPGPRERRGNNSDNSLADADGMISRGDYAGAMHIYKKILSDAPGDRKVMQRVEELRSLLKVTGKDKDALISRLNDFLEGVKRVRDGFSRST
jgi:tetratricopeptide (TPR) repeat protein